MFPALAASEEQFYAYVWEGYWIDIGTPSRYLRANQDVLHGRLGELPLREEGSPMFSGEGEPARIDDFSIIDHSCTIKAGAEISNSVLGANCFVEERARIEQAFPNARSRTYPVAAGDMFALVEQLFAERGWDIRTKRTPLDVLDTGQLNAIATTLLGWQHEVVVRVTGSAAGSTVAMRSASLTAFHDFAENGERIEAFLLDLDNRVTLMLRDAPPAVDAGLSSRTPPRGFRAPPKAAARTVHRDFEAALAVELAAAIRVVPPVF